MKIINLITYYISKLLKKALISSIKSSYIHNKSKVEAQSNIINTKMDKHSFCGYGCEISNCEIGSFTSISNNVIIGGGTHPMEWVGMSPVFYEGRDSINYKFSVHKRRKNKKVIIGSDVWIGQNVMIKEGIKIGHGAIIGMGSIVTKDIEPYMIYAGNPAKKIRERFNKKIIDDLLKIKWWELDEKTLDKYSYSIKDPKKFIKLIKTNCEK